MTASSDCFQRLEQNMRAVARSMADDCMLIRDAAQADIDSEVTNKPRPFDSVHAAARNALQANSLQKLGMGFIESPERVGSTTVHWWFRPVEDNPIAPLVPEAHPAMIDFYDFERSEWWQAAVVDEEFHISEPYVDALGTNAYVVTGSLALHADGTLFGVSAVDIEIGELQSRWQADLVEMQGVQCVLSAEGAVIATNSGRLLGESVNLAELDVDAVQPVSETPWIIARL